ncbi:MAG: hypothetical protein D6805_03990 [Planctomycetota bacterium]|nr:MAG: hypothetical protein D6805_03990 [Planctomycetota bacterium]
MGKFYRFCILVGLSVFPFFVWAADWFPLDKLRGYGGPSRGGIYVEATLRVARGQSFEVCGLDLPFRFPAQSRKIYNRVNLIYKPRKSILKIVGGLRKDFRGWYFSVQDIKEIELSFRDYFRLRFQTYTQSQDEKFSVNERIHRLYSLAFWARTTAEECGQSFLYESFKKAFLAGAILEVSALDSKEYDRRYQLAVEMERLGFKKEAFKTYRQCWLLRKSEHFLQNKLRELGGIFKNNQWKLREELEAEMGRKRVGKIFVVEEKARFLSFIKSQKSKKQVLGKRQIFYFCYKEFPVGISKREVYRRLRAWPRSMWKKREEGVLYEQWKFDIFFQKKRKIAYFYFGDGKLLYIESIQ